MLSLLWRGARLHLHLYKTAGGRCYRTADGVWARLADLVAFYAGRDAPPIFPSDGAHLLRPVPKPN